MWALNCTHNDTIFYLKPNKTISVGRIVGVCELAITGDTSVSRKHCSINVTDQNVTITDHASKYGTFINDDNNRIQKISPNTEVVLTAGDSIRFGILKNVWRLVRFSFVASTSKLTPEMKSALQEQLAALQGTLLETWNDDCNFLTMTKITLTHKVMMALISNACIVAPEFWGACVNACNTNTALPDPNDYIPKVLESTLNQEIMDFVPNEKRKTLFKNKKMIFFSKKQKQMYERAITSAAGSCCALSESKISKAMLCSQDVIVIQYLAKTNSQESQINVDNLNNIVNYMVSKGKRLIPESEIGLAVLYCSLEKYCNPDFDFLKQVCLNSSEKNEISTKSKVLAVETQEQVKCKVYLPPKVIDASLTCLKDEDVVIDDHKSDLSYTTSGNKRKLVGESPSTSNDVKKLKQDSITKNMFNFIEDETPPHEKGREGENTKEEKMLNLIIPKKRSRDVDQNKDDPFNFDCEFEPHSSPKRNKLNIFTLEATDKFTTEVDTIKRMDGKDQVKNALAIKSILDNSIPWLSKLNHSAIIKQEKDEVDNVEQIGLDDKLNSLSLGQTIVTVNDSLMVKKEQMVSESTNTNGPNFKKFRKIKPLKPQQNIIPKSAMVAYKPVVRDVFAAASDDEESENDEIIMSMNKRMIAKKSSTRSRKL